MFYNKRNRELTYDTFPEVFMTENILGVSKKLQDQEIEKVSHNYFHSINIQEQIFIYSENWGQPVRFVYN